MAKSKISGTLNNSFTVGTTGSGDLTAGNYLYNNGQSITSVISIVNKSSNATASVTDLGKMIVNTTANSTITYSIPNVSTASFAIGSRIQLFADSMASITVATGNTTGVTVLASKNLNNSATISNIQSATLTMISTDKWYMGP
jgi:K+/H+ antiporter YhaU regulatory subunit KhtT